MKQLKKFMSVALVCLLLLVPTEGHCDIWGGDVVVLTQILANAIQQLVQLRQIFSTGSDQFGLLRDINSGIRDGLTAIQLVNTKFNPGIYGNLDTADEVMRAIQDLYGAIPKTNEAKLEAAQDNSVSESIAMNGTLFAFADSADQESREIIQKSQVVSPQGAAKLTAQSLAILVGVTTQVLRTNSMMLKLMGENLALENRREKIQSRQFQTQYEGLSSAFSELPPDTSLTPLGTGK